MSNDPHVNEQKRIIMLDVPDRVRALERVPLLEGAPMEELYEIAERSHLLSFQPADVIVPEGEEGLGFYLVLAGRARVLRGGVEIDQLLPGGFFGEISLLEGQRRMATVVAAELTTCLGILRSFFRPMLVRNPRIALRILEEERRRLGVVGQRTGA